MIDLQPSTDIELIKKNRNIVIRKLWVLMKRLSDLQGQSMTDEDLDLWTKVTEHSAIQNRLNEKASEKENQTDSA